MDIIREIREDREIGAARLEAEYRSRLMAYALSVCDDRDEAESAVTHAFAEALNRIETLKNPKAFFGWLCGIVKNQHNMSVRRKEHERVAYTDELPEQTVDGNRQIAAEIDSSLLHDAIADLPRDLRESLMLRYFMDLPLSTIAKLLSLPVGTVKSRLHYARVTLGMRLGATVKKPAVALIAAALLLFGAIASVIVLGGAAVDVNSGEAVAADVGGGERNANYGNDILSGAAPDAPSVISTDSARHAVFTKKEKTTMKSTIGGLFRSTIKGVMAVAAGVMAISSANAEDPYISTAGNHGNAGERHFIDTAWTITPQTRVELDYALLEDWNESWKSSYLFGGSGISPWFTAFVQNGYIGFHNGSGWKELRTIGVNNKDVRFTAILDNANDMATLLYNGEVAASVATTHAATYGNATLKIASHVSGTNNFAAIKIYGVRIYEGGDKKRDYSPLVKGGIAGFRDSVTGTFLSGVDLTASENTPVAEDDPYLATDGESQYVDTYWHVTPQTRFELDYALVDDYASSDSVYLFSGSGQAPSWFAAFIRGGNVSANVGIGFANGLNASGSDANWKLGHLGTQALAKGIRHTVVIDNANGWAGTLATGVTNSYSAAAAAQSFQSGTIKIASHVNIKNFSAIKIYGYRIFEGGVKVHDYTPMRKGEQLGFKDSITGAFLADRHTIRLVPGGNVPEETEDGYIAMPVNNNAYYIDTEYQASSNTCFMLDCAPLDTWVDGMSAWYLFHGYGSQPFAGYFNKAGYGTRNITAGGVWDQGVIALAELSANVRRTFVLDNLGCKSLTLVAGITNGVKTISASTESCPANSYTIKIAANHNGSSNYVPMKVYGCRIYEKGLLVRDFVPCAKDGVAGLKDLITGLFVSYPPDKQRTSSNSLAYGGNILVEADPYIECSGANGPYIVTDYKPCGATRAEIDFAQTVIDTSTTHYPFSIHGGGDVFMFGIYAFTNGRYGYNCQDDSANWTHGDTTTPAQTLSRITLILDAKNGQYAVAEAGRTNKTYAISGSRSKRSTHNLPIFAGHDYAAANRMPMKLYSFKLYEDDVLVRDYVPAVKDGVAGLQDRLPNGKFLAPATGSFTYGGVFPVAVAQSAMKISECDTATLTAYAPGATSYRWLKNGAPIEGGETGVLTVAWRRPMKSPSDVYQAVALFTTDGLNAESNESAPMTVYNIPTGFIITIR